MRNARVHILFVLLLSAVTGCNKASNSDLAPVHGRVTLDGQPLANTSVAFQVPGKSLSGGFTDEHGDYEVTYKRGVKGAIIGMNQITILQDMRGSSRPQTVPARYNQNSELQRDVKPGDNEINFELTMQPK